MQPDDRTYIILPDDPSRFCIYTSSTVLIYFAQGHQSPSPLFEIPLCLDPTVMSVSFLCLNPVYMLFVEQRFHG